MCASLYEYDVIKPVNLLRALLPATDAFDRNGVPYYVSGTLASGVHGIDRQPLDAMLAVGTSTAELAQILAGAYECWMAPLLPGLGYGTMRLPQLRHPEVQPAIPLLPLRPGAAQRAQRLTVASDGIALPIASPEDVVLDLLPFVAPNPRSGSQVWYDLVSVLKAYQGRLDERYLRRNARPDLEGLDDLLSQSVTVPLAHDISYADEMSWIGRYRSRPVLERLGLAAPASG